jgi:pimeloyl-ACP methyl ester carboxylesterase
VTTNGGLESARARGCAFTVAVWLAAPPEAAAIFLHGYAGNFYVYCWEFAQAALAANLLTICPSTEASGAWWTQRGQATLEATLDYAQSLGARRIYLAGLSNGAAGATVLAQRFEPRLSGLVLISGVSRAQATELPTLVVQGESDRMMPPEYARAYAEGHNNVSYHELKGGHLIQLSSHLEVRAVIGAFLRDLESRAR